MDINTKKMAEMGFNVVVYEGGVKIHPKDGHSVINQLQELTDLPMSQCEILQAEINCMQVFEAIKRINR